MAGVSTDINTGQITKDDTKRIRVVGRDPNGNKLKLDEIDLKLTVDGTTTTYSLADFTNQSDEYTTKHKFGNAGLLDVDCTIKDDPNLDTERETDQSNFVRE